MQQTKWSEYKTPGILLAACLFMLLVLFIEWQQMGQYVPGQKNASLNPDNQKSWLEQIPEPVEILAAPEQYEEIKLRPIFFKGRRPLETAGATEDSYKGNLEFILTGVMVTPEGLSALLRDQKKQSHRLKLGEEINGWELKAVYAHKVYLEKDGKRKTLILRDSNKRAKKNLQSDIKPVPVKKAGSEKQDKKNEP